MFRILVRDLKEIENNKVIADIEWEDYDFYNVRVVSNVVGVAANGKFHFIDVQESISSDVKTKILTFLNDNWNGDYGEFCHYGICRKDYARLYYLFWVIHCDTYRLDKEIEAIMGTGGDAEFVFENIAGVDPANLSESDRSYLIQVGMEYEKESDFECEYMDKMKYIGRTNNAHLIFIDEDGELFETGLSLHGEELVIGMTYELLGFSRGWLTTYCRLVLPDDQW